MCDTRKFIKGTHHSVCRCGRVYSDYKEYWLRSHYHNGYLRVKMTHKGKKIHGHIHRLVATAFIKRSNIETQRYVIHIDGIRENNHVDNLKWVDGVQLAKHNKESAKKL